MTDDNFHKLALSESFERVAKVAEERQTFNKAMDNLIAQDADLIDTNDKDSAVLSPCPFCGSVQIEAFHHIDRGWGASWHVECVAEECGNSTCHHDTEATAIAAWNKRQPTQSDALQADALDFGNELIFACAGLRHEPIDTEAIFSITWDGFPYDVTIRAAQGQEK